MNNSWLDPLRRTLDSREQPVTVFFRDDDVGWDNAQLFTLLDIFSAHELPIDLAVIPQSVTPRLAAQLWVRLATVSARIGIHQHGFAHINHQSVGRKCEFGTERTRAAQHEDLALGQQLLREAFGEQCDAIFTPPWNRCTRETGQCLLDLGFRMLSRECGATPLNLPGLVEMPICIDWFASRQKIRLSREEFGRSCATAIASPQPVGFMFHHARMDKDEYAAATELLALLETHERVCCRLMREL